MTKPDPLLHSEIMIATAAVWRACDDLAVVYRKAGLDHCAGEAAALSNQFKRRWTDLSAVKAAKP